MICDVSVGVDRKTNDDVEHCKNSDKKLLSEFLV